MNGKEHIKSLRVFSGLPDREQTSQPMSDVLSNQTDEKYIKQHSFQLTVLSHALSD